MRFGPLAGAALLAIGRGHGIERFGHTPQAFLASLAPLIAFPLVGSAVMFFGGRPGSALIALLLTVVAQLTPPVASHFLAVRWGREAEWMRFATAFNWCQWAIPVAGFVLLIGLQLFTGGSLSEEQAAQLLILCLALYGIWLHWVVARNGLALSRSRAVLLVILVNGATVGLVMAPRLIGSLFR